jgi:RHS repeat-associated protein
MSIESSGLFGSNAARGIGYSMLRQYHPGLEKDIYTLSAYVKVVNNPVGAGEFTARIYAADKKTILAISERIYDTGGEWVRVTATMDTPAVPTYIAIVAGSAPGDYTGEEEVLWDGVKFERGSVATDFDQETFYTNYQYNKRGLLGTLEHNLESYTYEYDAKGNITKITEGDGNEAAYTYDSLNQLKTENRNTATSVAYAYDSHGNMISRTETVQVSEGESEVTEHVYTYYLDRLVGIEEKVDGATTSNKTLTYDGVGNLLNDGEYSYTWQMGRQLQGISGTGLTTSYKYNENGLRTEKTVNGQTHEYTLLGSSVTREVIKDSAGNLLWTIHYSYAGDSTPVSMNVNGTEYYYLKNGQGDITHIVDGDGNEVASYEYDAWGNHLEVDGGDIAELNPYRYRGYRYDSETGFYSLQSRYYDSEIGRFINADDTDVLGVEQGSLLQYNLFTYCLNNPVNRTDDSGYLSIPNWLKVTVGAVAIAGLAVATVATGGAAAVICGAALSGAIAGGASGAVLGAVGGGISGGWQGALDGACSGFMSGTLIGGATGAVAAGFNIATGATSVVGKAHGSTLHKLATNMEAGKMAASGQYSQIGLNKSLNTMGLNGKLRPDVIGIGKKGVNKLVEVVSPKQSINYISNKMNGMLSNNPGSVGKIVSWVRNLFK